MRQPLNIHVYLYKIDPVNNRYQYAMFQRSDDPHCWQGISGGVEEAETTIQAALRESLEEAGVPTDIPIYPLDTISCIPADVFYVHNSWGSDVLVCPMHFFARPFDGEITLSDEHLAVKWLPYPKAYDRIFWNDQRTALWELDQRLQRGNLIR